MNEPVNFVNGQANQIKSPRPRWLIFLIVFAMVFVGGCITRAIVGEYSPNEPEAYDPATLKPKKPEGFFQKVKYFVFSQDNELSGQSDDRVNILLLGIGGAGHDGPYLTDTMIIASIKPTTGQISMVSIPRDLAVKIPGEGIKKINNANSVGETREPGGGGEFTRELVSDTFGLDISYYIRVDFKAFAEIIDAVGGVTVDVERAFTDHTYPAPNYEYQTVSFAAGTQTMDGETALKFVRSRHGGGGEGSDFARARRQQKMLSALKNKLLSFSTLANPVRINNIRKSLAEHLSTNLEFSDIITLLKMLRDLNFKQVTNFVLDDSESGYLRSTYGEDGAFLLVPKTGDFNDINEAIDNIFAEKKKESAVDNNFVAPDEPPPSLPAANIEIQNGTWSAGLAARMKKRLEDRGFAVETIDNTAERPQTKSGIYNLTGRALEDLEDSLKNELRIPVKKDLPTGIQAATGTDILVILGEDTAE